MDTSGMAVEGGRTGAVPSCSHLRGVGCSTWGATGRGWEVNMSYVGDMRAVGSVAGLKVRCLGDTHI